MHLLLVPCLTPTHPAANGLQVVGWSTQLRVLLVGASAELALAQDVSAGGRGALVPPSHGKAKTTRGQGLRQRWAQCSVCVCVGGGMRPSPIGPKSQGIVAQPRKGGGCTARARHQLARSSLRRHGTVVSATTPHALGTRGLPRPSQVWQSPYDEVTFSETISRSLRLVLQVRIFKGRAGSGRV